MKENKEKYLELLYFVNSGKVKLFSPEDFKKIDEIRNDYSEKKDVVQKVNAFLNKFKT